MKQFKRTPGYMLVLGALLPASLLAQQVPDAGQILRNQTQPVRPALPAVPQQSVAPEQTQIKDEGPKVVVNGFSIEGATLIPIPELIGQLSSAVGASVTFAQLQQMSGKLVQYYANKGYYARVIIPPQQVQGGIVRLVVVEGKLGQVKFEGAPAAAHRLQEERIKGFANYRLESGKPLNVRDLGTGLQILNEQPGLKVRSVLGTGASEGLVDVTLQAQATPLVDGLVVVNNEGSRSTGVAQLVGVLNVNNPSGRLDRFTLQGTQTQGSTFVRGDYTMPWGYSGLRVGVNLSSLNYDLVQSSFAALQATGRAHTLGFGAIYPWVRTVNEKRDIVGSLEFKSLEDGTIAGITSDRRVSVVKIGFNGENKGAGGHVTNYALGLVLGNSDQRNAAARAADATSRQVQGGFSKIDFALGHVMPLSKQGWALSATMRGQLAGGNLDSSERLSLGGPSGVRAYPVSEATGDTGVIGTASVLYQYNEQTIFSGFVDVGHIKVNDNTWAGWNATDPSAKNSYGLAGVGVGVSWQVRDNAAVQAALAVPVGKNSGRDANGNNADGSAASRARIWVGLNMRF